MAISHVEFGEALRPSVISSMKKLNKVIELLNSVDASVTEALTDIATLKSNVTELQNDMNNCKVALFTPLDKEE